MKLWTMAVLANLCVVAFPLSIEMNRSEIDNLSFQVRAEATELRPIETQRMGSSYARIVVEDEAFQFGSEGQPEIPKLHRWLVVDPTAKYALEVKSEGFETYQDILLYPAQPDKTEEAPEPAFAFNSKAYSQNKWYGKKRIEVGKKIKLGELTILPITIFPVAYNPAKRELRVYRDIRVSLTANANIDNLRDLHPGQFALAQAKMLTLNGERVAQEIRSSAREKKYLILYAKNLENYAKEVGLTYLGEATIEYLEAAATTEALKKQIQDKYDHGGLDAVLLYGDESKIPLKTMNNYVGDYYYSLVSGSDKISDIAVARIPAKNDGQASLINNKMRRYHEIQKSGFVNKKVMLVAHRENYPGKYTANMEAVRKLPNPRNLEFNTQYGGEKGKNSTVINESQGGYAIINYRGHGSSSTWSSWGQDGKSFTFSEVGGLPNLEKTLPFIFNVACSNATIQSSSETLVERELFPSQDINDLRGAVGALGATTASQTDVNHRFDINLFTLLQNSDDLTIGNIYTAANNKLTKDAGGNPPSNVLMYMLFADPLLRPWIN